MQAMGLPAVWEGVLEGFLKGRSGAGGMSLPVKSLMMPALRKAIYKVAAHSEDMGLRCLKVVAETSMDDEEFAKLESEANASENIKLAGLRQGQGENRQGGKENSGTVQQKKASGKG